MSDVITKEEDTMLRQIAKLSAVNDDNDKMIRGYRTTITRLNEEIRCHEYDDLQLQEAQREVFRLRKELGR